nr:daptide biosynthesis RiPP recognition protein [Streptomyces sp. RPT161]
MEYEGSFIAPGDEMSVGEDFFVEVQDYAVAPFLAIAGPTLLRVTGENDFEAFLHDADQARERGAFLPALVHPMIQLGDLCALGGAHDCGGPRHRLFVNSLGEVRTAPHGALLGTVRDGLEGLTAVWSSIERAPGSGCPVCLGQAVPTAVLEAAHRQRPWLSRYLHALDALRMAAARGLTELRVSGFAERLVTTGDQDAPAVDLTVAGAEAPLLLFNPETAVLHEPLGNRQFQLSMDAARLVELLMVHGDHGVAAEMATRHLGLGQDAALSAVAQVESHLTGAGVRLPAAPAGIPAITG